MTEPPIHALYFLTRSDSQGVEKYCRVCHNHLKQPYRIGETLHHQGTCYLSIFRVPIFPCNKVLMVDPVLPKLRRYFFPKIYHHQGHHFSPHLLSGATTCSECDGSNCDSSCSFTVKLMRQHPGATFHRLKWQLEKNFMEVLIPEISRIMPCFQVVQISLRGSTGLIWIKFQEPCSNSMANGWIDSTEAPNVPQDPGRVWNHPPKRYFHRAPGTAHHLGDQWWWKIHLAFRTLECLTRSCSGWVFFVR